MRLDRRAAPLAYGTRRYDLVGLSAGPHTLTLGMFTDIAFAWRFTTSFDDVAIASAAEDPIVGVPLPSLLLLMGSVLAVIGGRRSARAPGGATPKPSGLRPAG